jgi:hypothetical protein
MGTEATRGDLGKDFHVLPVKYYGRYAGTGKSNANGNAGG